MDLSDKGPNSKASHWIVDTVYKYSNYGYGPSLPPARPLQSLNNSKGRVRARIQHGSRLPQPNYLHLFIKIKILHNIYVHIEHLAKQGFVRLVGSLQLSLVFS
ncbi:hypothetical protein NC651_018517 [Populus alba x Populus x berolinensis]|nr:hypothetical protein NC651_018517 [Populus alba x Populus x berolinensis]